MQTPPPFVVFALPRSRTHWLSRFLTCGGWNCGHDQAQHVRSVADVRSWLSLWRVGTVETAAAPFWRMLATMRPDAKVVVVRRPVPDVVASLKATGVQLDWVAIEKYLRRADRKLDAIAAHFPGALSVQFDDLRTEGTCRAVFEHCLGIPHDAERWRWFDATNMQIDLGAVLRYMRAHAPQLRRAEALCVREINRSLRGGSLRLGPVQANGITIQEEPLAIFMRDGQALFEEHCEAVGEAPDEWTRKNIPMIEAIESVGGWQYMTARCNGRMLGYLQTLIGPSLESTTRVSATQGLFFVSKDAAGLGLGLKLQRASIAALRARGVGEIRMREGVRGSGPKLGVLYRRLGAMEDGHLYRLDLEAA